MSRTKSASQARTASLKRRRRARIAGAVALGVAVVVGLAIMAGAGEDPAPSPPKQEARADTACGAEPPPQAQPQQYEAPEDVLESGVDYSAVLDTSCGDIRIDLLEEQAPATVNSFVFLAREGFFDGLVWHRVVQKFVIQTGDPDGLNGHAPDDAGYSIPDELGGTEGRDYVFGVVAMANTGQPDTGGSQFFIVVQPEGPAGLDPLYTIFGQAQASEATLLEISGKDTVGGTDPQTMDEPQVPIYINEVRITER
ncbi:MAG: peptidylprolyl isomerase [Actinomycetota bacterium]|nr:peptidylprolyl isomerase [Actinomycetota bacterium]